MRIADQAMLLELPLHRGPAILARDGPDRNVRRHHRRQHQHQPGLLAEPTAPGENRAEDQRDRPEDGDR